MKILLSALVLLSLASLTPANGVAVVRTRTVVRAPVRNVAVVRTRAFVGGGYGYGFNNGFRNRGFYGVGYGVGYGSLDPIGGGLDCCFHIVNAGHLLDLLDKFGE